jgi:alginate O-acetyltransferase complex protein AlgJ
MHRILLTLLILPGLLWIVRPEGGTMMLENRNRATLPEPPAGVSGLTEYLAGVDAFVADNIGLRDQLIRAKNRLTLKFNGQSNTRVIAGENGWLYYNAPEVVQRNAGLIFQPERVENMLRFVEEAKSLAEAQGARFIAMPVPNSHSVYRKYLPDWARPDIAEPMTEQRAITEGLKARGVPTSDPYLLFRSRDLDTQPLYYRRDTHWNNFGAYLAFYDAMAQFGLSQGFPEPETILKGYVEGEYYGVLDQFLGLEQAAEVEPLPDMDMTSFARRAERSVNETDDHVSMDSYEVTYASDGPRLLVIGDSFSYDFFRRFWGLGFSAVHWSHHDYGRYDRNVFESFRPDYVIFEFVDWEVPAWVPFDARPVRS